jgi:hypothetical protein
MVARNSTVIFCCPVAGGRGRHETVFLALTAKGAPIPINDVWIAACCMGVGGTLVARDRHFYQVEQIDKIILSEEA